TSRAVVATRSARPSERIDVVDDRALPQQHLADDMARLDVPGEDRGEADARRRGDAERRGSRRQWWNAATLPHFSAGRGENVARGLPRSAFMRSHTAMMAFSRSASASARASFFLRK